MRALEHTLHRYTAGILVGILTFGLVSSATATATFDAESSLLLTLVDVTDANSARVDSGWAVTAEGFLFDSNTYETGDATVSITPTLTPVTTMEIGDTVFQSVAASGSASNGGFAFAFLKTNFGALVENLTDVTLTFEFAYTAASTASVSGSIADGDDAYTSTYVQVADRGEFLESYGAYADLAAGRLSDSGGNLSPPTSHFITVSSGQSDAFTGILDVSRSWAESVVPTPASITLIGLGLAGIGYYRRKQNRSA